MNTPAACLLEAHDTSASVCNASLAIEASIGIESLSTHDLCEAIGRLVEVERQAEWRLCRHVAELADRFERGTPELFPYADIYQLARLRFGMSVRRVRERVRIGRALRCLPRIEEAFIEGALGYAKVREVTRVAEPQTDAQWLATATELPLRILEQRVAEANRVDCADHDGADPHRTSEAAVTRWASARSIEVRLTMPARAWALLERAMEGARQESESSLSDAEALEAVARDALDSQTGDGDRADVRNMVVMYACKTCQRREIETGRGPIEIGDDEAATIACGAKHCDLETEGRAVTQGGELPASVRRAVMLRDRMRCRAPGCTGRRYVDVHHVKAREHGGEHSRRNCVVLCGRCHARVHDGQLRIEGDADKDLAFYDATGEPLERREMTPGGHAHDADVSAPAMTVLETIAQGKGWGTDSLCNETGLKASDVSCALLELQLAGLVRQEPTGYVAIGRCLRAGAA